MKTTAADILVRAASDLHAAGITDPTEWDLTVAAWSLSRIRFGMRDHEASYPDHKKVYVVLLAAVRAGLVEKVRANVYRLTEAGKVRAAELRAKAPA